ncbi:unnamed protein product [Eruca vesicaria subsp. sativa]|uniref:Uncharacterized protein n=1 Tax=Eruca vesicaria subsp. sativa TaxID=29727 RepID=A0ABC8L899_ERUVS|nr:unnamed protein product [Eruca vesicaria subsp. sativa]
MNYNRDCLSQNETEGKTVAITTRTYLQGIKLRDILRWCGTFFFVCGVDNAKGTDIMKPVEAEFYHTLFYLKSRGYSVLLASPDKEVASQSILRSVDSIWLSTSLLEQGNLDELSNICITNFDYKIHPKIWRYVFKHSFGDGEIKD